LISRLEFQTLLSEHKQLESEAKIQKEKQHLEEVRKIEELIRDRQNYLGIADSERLKQKNKLDKIFIDFYLTQNNNKIKEKIPFDFNKASIAQLNDESFYDLYDEEENVAYILRRYLTEYHDNLYNNMCCGADLEKVIKERKRTIYSELANLENKKITYGQFNTALKTKLGAMDDKLFQAIAEKDKFDKDEIKKKKQDEKAAELTLKDFYEASMATNDCYEIRKSFNIQYINLNTRQSIIRKMKLIETDFLRKDPKINKNALWEEATLGYNKGLSKLIEVGYLMPNKVIGDVNSICLMTSMMIMTYEVEAGMNKQRIKNF
jgi:hypothetical protein